MQDDKAYCVGKGTLPIIRLPAPVSPFHPGRSGLRFQGWKQRVEPMSHAAKALAVEVQNIKVLSKPGMIEYYPAHLESAKRMAAYWAQHLIAGTY